MNWWILFWVVVAVLGLYVVTEWITCGVALWILHRAKGTDLKQVPRWVMTGPRWVNTPAAIKEWRHR